MELILSVTSCYKILLLYLFYLSKIFWGLLLYHLILKDAIFDSHSWVKVCNSYPYFAVQGIQDLREVYMYPGASLCDNPQNFVIPSHKSFGRNVPKPFEQYSLVKTESQSFSAAPPYPMFEKKKAPKNLIYRILSKNIGSRKLSPTLSA